MTVFNKVELLSPLGRALLARKHPDAVLVSAIHRETTRALVARIATELAERWKESARPPETEAEGAPLDVP